MSYIVDVGVSQGVGGGGLGLPGWRPAGNAEIVLIDSDQVAPRMWR